MSFDEHGDGYWYHKLTLVQNLLVLFKISFAALQNDKLFVFDEKRVMKWACCRWEIVF